VPILIKHDQLLIYEKIILADIIVNESIMVQFKMEIILMTIFTNFEKVVILILQKATDKLSQFLKVNKLLHNIRI